MVCFESAFPDMSRHLARDGAELLIAQSATSTFQQSWAPEQHASLAALRAAETGRPMVHATLTGVSRGVRPGRRARRLPARHGREHGGGVRRAAGAAVRRAYVRFGDWPVYAALLVLLAWGAVEGVRAVRLRRRASLPLSGDRIRTTRSHSS